MSHPPHEGVAFVWENADFHDGSEGGEGLSHQLFWVEQSEREHQDLTPTPLGGCSSRWGPLPVSPVLTPPQYTVQLLGLDWFTTSSKHSCLELPAHRRQRGGCQGPGGGGGGAPAAACTATHFRRWSSGLGAFLWPSWFESACLPTTGRPSAGWRSPHPGSTMSH